MDYEHIGNFKVHIVMYLWKWNVAYTDSCRGTSCDWTNQIEDISWNMYMYEVKRSRNFKFVVDEIAANTHLQLNAAKKEKCDYFVEIYNLKKV